MHVMRLASPRLPLQRRRRRRPRAPLLLRRQASTHLQLNLVARRRRWPLPPLRRPLLLLLEERDDWVQVAQLQELLKHTAEKSVRTQQTAAALSDVRMRATGGGLEVGARALGLLVRPEA